MSDCDKCGRPKSDADEVLCRSCKPSIAARQAAIDADNEISRFHWECARPGKMPRWTVVIEARDKLNTALEVVKTCKSMTYEGNP